MLRPTVAKQVQAEAMHVWVHHVYVKLNGSCNACMSNTLVGTRENGTWLLLQAVICRQQVTEDLQSVQARLMARQGLLLLCCICNLPLCLTPHGIC